MACLRRAVESFREAGTPFPVAVALLELAEHLVADGHADEAQPALGEAREIFERLRARPWLERLENVSTAQIGVPA